MKSKQVEVYSDGICYWWRWFAVYLSLGMFYALGTITFGGAPAHTYHMLLAVAGAIGMLLAFFHRPKSFKIEATEKELRILRVPGDSVKRAFHRDDVRYVTIRNTGHLFGLSVLCIIVRTKKDGSKFFGPVYREGIDGVSASEVAQLLPRISREGLMPVMPAKDSKSS